MGDHGKLDLIIDQMVTMVLVPPLQYFETGNGHISVLL